MGVKGSFDGRQKRKLNFEEKPVETEPMNETAGTVKT